MTCIAGLIADGRIWMGGDSVATAGAVVYDKAEPKIFRREQMLIGVSGSPRATQLLQHGLSLEPCENFAKLDKYMACDFVDAVRECLKDGGYAKKKDEQESFDSILLVGFGGCLFTVFTDYQVHRDARNFAAIGSGMHEARGSLFTTASMRLSPRVRIRRALQAAAAFDAHVRPPFVIRSMRCRT